MGGGFLADQPVTCWVSCSTSWVWGREQPSAPGGGGCRRWRDPASVHPLPGVAAGGLCPAPCPRLGLGGLGLCTAPHVPCPHWDVNEARALRAGPGAAGAPCGPGEAASAHLGPCLLFSPLAVRGGRKLRVGWCVCVCMFVFAWALGAQCRAGPPAASALTSRVRGLGEAGAAVGLGGLLEAGRWAPRQV